MGNMPDEPFEIKAQVDTASDWYEIGKASRLEVFGNNGFVPIYLVNANRYIFDLNHVNQIHLQGYKQPLPLVPNIVTESLEAAMTVSRRNMSDEHLIITALVRQLGGVASISEAELLAADKVAHMTSHRIPFPHRFVIRVED